MKIEYPYSFSMPGNLVSLMRLTHRPVARCHVVNLYFSCDCNGRQAHTCTAYFSVLNWRAALTQCQVHYRHLSAFGTFHFHNTGRSSHLVTQKSAAGFAANLNTNWFLFDFHYKATPFRAWASLIK